MMTVRTTRLRRRLAQALVVSVVVALSLSSATPAFAALDIENPTATPTSVAVNSTTAFQFSVESKQGQTHPTASNDNPECVRFTLTGFSSLTSTSLTQPAGHNWSITSVAGNVVTATADGTAADQLHKTEVLSLNVTATAPSTTGPQTWTVKAYDDTGCTLQEKSKSATVTVVAFTATGTVSPQTVFRGQNGVDFAFAVTNTAGTSIGSVQIKRPNADFEATVLCGTGPAGWTPTLSGGGGGDTCTFNSAAGTGDNIAAGSSGTFHMTTDIKADKKDKLNNAWDVKAHTADTFGGGSLVAVTQAAAGDLETDIFTFQVSDAVVVSGAGPAVNTACPPVSKSAPVGSSRTIVICGNNHGNDAITPTAAGSSLSGTMIGTAGTFASGSIPAGATNVVLANFTATTITASASSAHTVIPVVGTGTGPATSPAITLNGYSAFGPLDHFEVTAPVNATAGSPFSVTVVAKDSANVTITDHTGTAHFTSTDPQAVLPSDYTFVTGDNGVHTFTNAVTLKTAGDRTVSVNDTSDITKTGTSGTIVVAPGTVTKLVFDDQPSNALASQVISPAVTVRIEDEFGNLVTTDDSTQVTVAIGTNPNTGTLAGTTAVTAVDGIATFSDLSIDHFGTGYTLTAADTTGGGAPHPLTGDTSASFNISARSTSTVVLCSPGSVSVGAGTTCTATVTDTGAGGSSSTPAGSVAFTSDSAGGFDATSCVLSSGSCSVTYTPSAVDGGTHNIGAAYTPNDDVHASSSDGNGFDVTVVAGDDNDGVPAEVEDGAPNGGDGNNDGTLDSQQPNVASRPSAIDFDGNGQLDDYVTLESPVGTTLSGVSVIDPGTLSGAPAGVDFPVGLVEFTVNGVRTTDPIEVLLYVPAGVVTAQYWKHQGGVWSNYSGNVNLSGNPIVITLQDNISGMQSGLGDDNDDAGVIHDPSGPAATRTPPAAPVELVPRFTG